MAFALNSEELYLIVIVVVLAVVVLGVLLYLRRRLQQRREKLLGELQDRPQLTQDRAFNRIAMARRESEILARQGADITNPRDLIAQAQGAFDTRNYDRAYQLAQQAHEALVHARMDSTRLPSSAATGSPPSGSASHPIPNPVPVATSAGSPSPPPAPSIPKNRAESQFQLRLLDQELETAQHDRPGSAATGEAVRLRSDAGGAFDHGDYTEAFRLALKGRRTIGATVESLPLTGPTGMTNGPVGDRPGVDVAESAEQVADAERCPSCGYPALPGDSFCRGCGKPRDTVCAKCGAPRQPTDTFCGRCGAPFG